MSENYLRWWIILIINAGGLEMLTSQDVILFND